MKRIYCLAATFLVGVFLSTTSADAQTITAGGGVGYGSKSENANIQANLYYSLPGAPVRLGADVGYSNPEKTSQARVDEIESNLNVHLMAVDNKIISLYGLTGLNILHIRSKVEVQGQSSITDSDTNFGLNLGAGAELDIGFGRTFGEAKYIIGPDDRSQLVLGAGVRVRM